MSRWDDNLAAISEDKWLGILEAVDALSPNDVLGNENYSAELERLKKTTRYISELVSNISLDPELLPATLHSKISTFEASLKQLKNNLQPPQKANLITSVNNNADAVIVQIMPFVLNADSARAAGQAMRHYRESIEAKTKDVEEYHRKSQQALQELFAARSEISTYKKELVEGDENTPSIKANLDKLYAEIAKYHTEIKSYHTALNSGDEEEAAIKLQISQAKASSEKNSDAIETMLEKSTKQISDLKKFYDEVYGEPNEEAVLVGGLKQELETRKKELSDFSEAQSTKYNGLVDEIEGLLPGATSAGLASAYNDLKVKAEVRETNFALAFYGGLVLLTVLAAFSITQNISFRPFVWNFVDISNPITYLQKIAYKLPIVVPTLWFTVAISKRRSEMHRLKEEYAHKEALAISYHGFKQQIEALGIKNDPLVRQLLEAILVAVSFNPSKTLDGKHGDKMPIQDMSEGIVKSIMDKFDIPKKP